MNKSNNQTTMESLCIVHVDTDVWSGKLSLQDNEIKLGSNGSVPPKDFASLGQKKMIDPETLKPFGRLQGRLRTLFSNHGMPFLNGRAIPMDKELLICQELDLIANDWKFETLRFIDEYETEVESWAKKKDLIDPIYGRAVRVCKLPKEVVLKRFGFEYHVYKIMPTAQTENSAALASKVGSLGNDLVDEVVKIANDLYTKRLLGKDRVSKRSLRQLVPLRDKVDGLSFLDSSFTSVVNLLDKAVEDIDFTASDGCVTGLPFYQVVAAVLTISDKTRFDAYIHGNDDISQIANTMYWDDSKETPLANLELAMSVEGDISLEETVEVKQVDETEIAKAIDETEITKAIEETEIAKAIDETEITKAIDETEITKAIDETEITKAIEETEIAKAIDETEIAKAIDETEIESDLDKFFEDNENLSLPKVPESPVKTCELEHEATVEIYPIVKGDDLVPIVHSKELSASKVETPTKAKDSVDLYW